MITANNYFKEIKPILSKLPSEVKEAHNLVTAMLNDGINNPFNTGDKDIDEMGELLLQKANNILNSSEPKETKPKAKLEKTMEQKVIERYPKATKKLAEKRQKQAAKKTPAKKAAKSAKFAGKKTATKVRKANSKKIKKIVKNVRKADAAKPSVTKKVYTKEMELIKAFVSINGKELTKVGLTNKRNAVKNALVNEKTNQHVEILKNILNRYNKGLNAINETTTHIKCSIETGFFNKCKQTIANAKIKVRTDVLGKVEAAKK